MRLVDRLRLGWQLCRGGDAPVDQDAVAWGVSLIVHALILLLLAAGTLLIPVRERLFLAATTIPPEKEIQIEKFHFSPELQDQVGALGSGGAESARPLAPQTSDVTEVALPVPPTPLPADMQVDVLQQTQLTAPEVTENLSVKGIGSVGTRAASGAIDRVTHEILLALDQRPTLVIWLFDASGSLRAQREEIVSRFDRIYEELGVIEASQNDAFRRHRDKPLLTVVASFGARMQSLTRRPTDDLQQIKEAVRAVEEDQSGVENVFSAIDQVATAHRHYRLKAPRRNVMIVVFTDEAGDDLGQLERAVESCRKYEMPVYVVGVPAPFGRQNAYVRYVDPDPRFDQRTQWIPVRQGPESLVPERIKLAFTGTDRDDEALDSGFGPFALTRLTYETGGIYFMVHPQRDVGRRIPRRRTRVMSSHLSRFFDPTVMRAYRPDYMPLPRYQKFVQQNQARLALVEAARLTWALPMRNPRTVFPKIDDAAFARDLSIAQRAAAELEPVLQRVVSTLAAGESDRPRLLKPRWQAGYDLAMGRALAVAVRTFGYNTMLAQAKQGMTFQKKSDTWRLVPADDIHSGSVHAGQAARAHEYLQRVVDQHAGTPWAWLAERELATPFGWQWQEEFRNLQARRQEQASAARQPNRRNTPPGPPARPLRKPPAL